MKHNLKNRPRYAREGETFGNYHTKVEKWFEGFEKELRELLAKERELWKHDESVAIRYLKEILGDVKE